ncbi:MAG: hypothetical protein CMJ78_04990 [Planctomycetaceae bacterium]|nr:hypothetical protein [Planctomycetaceae bacterium]
MVRALLSITRRMYSLADSPCDSAAFTISLHESSSMRKYRFGVNPVDGRPRFRASFESFIPEFYDHPNKSQYKNFMGGQKYRR